MTATDATTTIEEQLRDAFMDALEEIHNHLLKQEFPFDDEDRYDVDGKDKICSIRDLIDGCGGNDDPMKLLVMLIVQSNKKIFCDDTGFFPIPFIQDLLDNDNDLREIITKLQVKPELQGFFRTLETLNFLFPDKVEKAMALPKYQPLLSVLYTKKRVREHDDTDSDSESDGDGESKKENRKKSRVTEC